MTVASPAAFAAPDAIELPKVDISGSKTPPLTRVTDDVSAAPAQVTVLGRSELDARTISTLRRSGLNVLSVDHERPNDGSLGNEMKALPVDKITLIATYAFQVH